VPIYVWIALALVLIWIYLWRTANRLDRLHTKAEATREALDAQLVRRSAVSLELAASGQLDPATSLLIADAAHAAREAPESEREQSESNLSRALRAALDEPGQFAELEAVPIGAELLAEVGAASRRVVMARRFHNSGVDLARRVRRKRVVRWLHLAGHAPLPETFEIDDAEPECLHRSL